MIHYVDSPVIKPKIIWDKKESKSEIEPKEKLERVEKLEIKNVDGVNKIGKFNHIMLIFRNLIFVF